jgi:hypothetical protein
MRKWLTPFAYTEDGGKTVHLCADRVCLDLGLPITEENLGIAALVLEEFATTQLGSAVQMDSMAEEVAAKMRPKIEAGKKGRFP